MMREDLKEDFLTEKKILDMTCGCRSMWFNKNHPLAVYCDKNKRYFSGEFGKSQNTQTINVDPDVICDFTNLPFEDESFSLVVFDPPHLIDISENAWLVKKYGMLKDDWKQMLHDGFMEGMRVLKTDGVLIFKWAESHIPASEVWDAIGQKPLFGHHSGKKLGTFWGCFMKGAE